MPSFKFVAWQQGDAWLGYLHDHPDYWTQGKSLNDLKAHLDDLFRDLTNPGERLSNEPLSSTAEKLFLRPDAEEAKVTGD